MEVTRSKKSRCSSGSVSARMADQGIVLAERGFEGSAGFVNGRVSTAAYDEVKSARFAG